MTRTPSQICVDVLKSPEAQLSLANGSFAVTVMFDQRNLASFQQAVGSIVLQ